ncbi:MAG TPA: lysylphosphatidylglycerol synthase domain-containing protein [Streptosporangiaceae bacterium]|nr:lysylphosphatidylglycerol synthase domain-containing protein [Streptosporangiaceae bacterium]
MIRLISAGLLLAGAFAASAAAFRWLLGPAAPVPGGLGTAGRVITGLVQVACLAAAVVVVAATLRKRRFRLLAGLAAGAVAAAGLTAGILALLGAERPATLTANQARGSWLASTAFPAPALLAAAVAVVVAAAPWLSRPWRRAAWLALLLAGAARLLTGAVLPAELILALAAGVTAGAAVLVTLGVPDRRIGPAGIVAALRHAGLPVESVRPAEVEARGSRPFAAVTADGRRLFVKALGSDQRDADLLYRAYRAVRLRNVGDTRPAASLLHAVEHQALVGLMAERAGVSAPGVDRVVRAGDTVLLVMPWTGGCSLDRLPPGQIGDDLLARLWAEVDKLHRAGIAHRSLRAANVMADPPGRPTIVDFSFSELDATPRQMDLDVAELLASLAVLAGEDRVVSAAAGVLGAGRLSRAVPLLQPLALSAATRRAVAGHDGLLTRTRTAAATASGLQSPELARVQRVRPRTLLAIAALTGAFYYLLPKLAQVGSSWHALQSAHWIWLPVVIAFSALTYLAGAISLLGSVTVRLPFWPTVLTQGASSFINRVSPANVGGMALNVRYLQKTGVEPSAGVAAVGVNALAGAIVHVILLVIFLSWAGRGAGQAFKLPSGSKLLLILAILAAVVGLILATRQGRKFAVRKLLPSLRSSLASLWRVARSPVRLALLFGGSALVTLAYIGGLVASVAAFGASASIAQVGAVYLIASFIAAASPTPGGLGAIEAATIAGLTGIGVSSGPAVSAVLVYRLATYWLPVLPGWYSWRLLQRMGYV